MSCGAGSSACGADEFCEAATNTCRACGDLSSVTFGTPVSRLAPNASRGELGFPRVSIRDGQRVLVFRARATGAEHDDIFSAPLGPDGAPGTVTSYGCCVNKPTNDSGALALPSAITGATLGAVSNHGDIASTSVPYLLIDSYRDFDRASAGGGRNPEPGQPPRRRFHVVQWDAGAGTPNGYGPLPLLNTGLDDFSAAFAGEAGLGASRFYWMSTRGTPEVTELRTLKLGESAGSSAAVVVRLEGCPNPVTSSDFRPWLTPDGTRLIFDARCNQADPPTLWMTTPNEDGTLPPAKPLVVGGAAAKTGDTAGALSPNKCEIWFMRAGQIHSASRQ